MLKSDLLKYIMLALFVAIGVVISPILRIEGMCPTAHLVNIVCAVFLGPYYALACAVTTGALRMALLGVPPLALTGAVFGAFLSGVLYRASRGRLWAAVLGEVAGTGLVGSLASYPVMAFVMGRGGLTWFFYTPLFVGATLIGGGCAYLLLKVLAANGMLTKLQRKLGVNTYE